MYCVKCTRSPRQICHHRRYCGKAKMSTFISIVLVLLLMTFYNSAFALTIGAFNIRVFGASKSSKPDVMDVLAKIVQRYDILLVQEIRDSKGDAIKVLINTVNSLSSSIQYDYVISERLGRTSQKEQYAFVYRKSTGITVLGTHTHNDGEIGTQEDVFEREPYMVHFKTQATELNSFVLAGVHIRPDDAVKEIKQLYEVFADAEAQFGTTDVIVMGDLNADCSYVSKSAWSGIPIKHDTDYHWLIGDDVDTTVGTTDCAYDRIIMKGNQFLNEVVEGSAKVFDFQTEYNLNGELALSVSDHFPVEVQLKDDTTSGVSGWQEGSIAVCVVAGIGTVVKILQNL